MQGIMERFKVTEVNNTFWKGWMCCFTNLGENSFLAMVLVNNFEILFDKNSFSRIFLIDGLLEGSLINISASKSFKS